MKKLICLLVFILTVASVTGCDKPQDTLSYDEIMSLDTVGPACVESFYNFDDLQGFISDCSDRNIDLSLVTASVKDVSHYMTWNKEHAMFGGYTETEICIEAVDSQYNGMTLNVGDTVVIKQDYHICFEKDESVIPFVAEKIGKKVDTVEKMKEIEPFTLKMELYKNEKYKLFINDNEMPMKKGETYSMALCKSSESNNKYYNCYFVSPISMKGNIEALESSYNLRFCDIYKTVSAEIKKMFTK